jgi:hypothetical protein
MKAGKKMKGTLFSSCLFVRPVVNFFFVSILFLTGTAGLFAAEGEVSFSIRYFDQKIYYLEQEPIMIQITISNNSPEVYRFKLADERAFSVDFDVRSMNNRLVEPAEELLRRRNSSGSIFFRELSVESGESFSFIEDLRRYVNLSAPGSYIVRAQVFPELYRNASLSAGSAERGAPALQSNRLSLRLRPPALPGPDGNPMVMDPETNAALRRERIPPDEVISYILSARQKSQWDKFFLYLDLESMLNRDPVSRRRWLASGEEDRQKMTDNYRQQLSGAMIDGDISSIPTEFTIERTLYSGLEGTVTVLEKFREGNYTALKRYVYTLRRQNDIWMVADYTVTNLGTE